MGTEIKELYSALQRFIERRPKMHIAPKQDDDDIIIANAFDELERLREENKRLREALEQIKEYWNGNPESAVDAIEEAIHTAEEAVEGGGE